MIGLAADGVARSSSRPLGLTAFLILIRREKLAGGPSYSARPCSIRWGGFPTHHLIERNNSASVGGVFLERPRKKRVKGCRLYSRGSRLQHPRCSSSLEADELPATRSERLSPDLSRFLPPGGLITAAMHLAMMSPAQRHRELIADLPAERAALRVTEMMSIRRETATDQAGMTSNEILHARGHEPDVVPQG